MIYCIFILCLLRCFPQNHRCCAGIHLPRPYLYAMGQSIKYMEKDDNQSYSSHASHRRTFENTQDVASTPTASRKDVTVFDKFQLIESPIPKALRQCVVRQDLTCEEI
jgi:hypothetical protein